MTAVFRLRLIAAVIATVGVFSPLGRDARASCGATNLTWNGVTSNAWTTATNWTPNTIPTLTSQNALIASGSSIPIMTSETLGCLEVDSGELKANANGITMTIDGDHFRALNAGSLVFTSGDTVTIDMNGTGSQTLEVVDNVNYVTLSGNNTVTFTQPFEIRNTLSITGTSTVLDINANLLLNSGTTVFTIPAGTTVNVASGVTLTAKGGITVNGTLTLAGGSSLVIGNGSTLSVAAGGALQLNGTSGNSATIDSVSTTYTFNMAGTMSASFFSINHTAATGLNVTGTVSSMQNGDFHYVKNAGVAITAGSTAVLPSTMDSLGFHDDGNGTGGFGNNFNFNPLGFVGTTTLTNWSGNLGGSSKMKSVNTHITWGSSSTTVLTLTDKSAAGTPPTTMAASAGPSLFAAFGFDLSNSGTAADITHLNFTMYGTANSSDISYIQVFADTAGTCVYAAGTDVQIGSNLTMSGSPITASLTVPPGTITTNGSNVACVFVLLATSATAQTGNTLGISIEATGDVTNNGGYSFGPTSSPPVRPGTSTITGTQSHWDGSTSTVWALASNWTPATIPSTTVDCVVGSGTRIPVLAANQACRNTTLQTGGTLNFNSTSFQLQTVGSLNIQSGYTFQNAASGVLAMVGSTDQSIAAGATAFPGNLLINSTGGAAITVDDNTTIGGSVTVTAGNLSITSGSTLTVGGNITVQTGATLTINPGAILSMANGTTLTVDSGGTLALLGSSGSNAEITLTSGASGYGIVINGTIQAQFYTIDHMGVSGLTINSGAIINATNFLQNGSFTFPVVNSTVMLTLNRQVPGNALSNMVFDASGSTATGVTNILTNTTAGTLTISTYSGSWSGPSFNTDPTYLINWTGATNTINITQQSTGPTSVNQSTTNTMGSFAFQQTNAGASFVNANITSLTLNLTGTGSASDISAVRIFYDSGCTGSGGTQLGSDGTFTGSTPQVTFSGISATVEASTTSPPKRCIYVQYDIASGAVSGDTVGVEIAANSDFVNDQTYAVAAGTPLPVTLGTASNVIGSTTTWTGTTNTDFCTGTNWSGGLPSSSINCTIVSRANLPVINGTTCTLGTCKTVTINSGSLTVSSGGTLAVFGSLTNNATFTNSGTLELEDSGSAINQTITGASSLGTVNFAKTGGGTARAAGTSTITTLTIPGGSNFEWDVNSGDVLTLTNGLTLSPANATFNIKGGGTLKIPSGQSITVSGGTFETTGTNDAYPQASSTKGKITNNGSGTWAFSATSGTVSLTGFWIDALTTAGLQIGGTTKLSALNGGEFTSLQNSFPMNAIQLNTTGTIPTTATNVGWYWGTGYSGTGSTSTLVGAASYTGTPALSANYLLASSTGCASQAISFNQWFGDFFFEMNQPTTSTKVSATSCSITIAASASPVTLKSFTATAYDGAVSLDWTTGSELDHEGFNVYRSTSPDEGFVQINSSLIRNILSSATLQGIYRYVDADVIDGTQYYYQIQDVAYNGDAQMHGPVWATPNVGDGTVPGTPAGTNSGSSTPGSDTGNGVSSPGPIANLDQTDLGNGVHVLTQTDGSLRIEIIPPPISFPVSAWNANYQSISLPGYASMLAAGQPELVSRTILIQVDPTKTTAQVTHATVQEATVSSHQIEPVPSYSLSGGTLVPTYAPGAAAYALNAFTPSTFYTVNPALQVIGGNTFLSITATPVLYNAVTQQLREATDIVLDIGLGGAAWTAPTPSTALALSPSAVEGTLRIRYRQTGMYELDYSDIATAGLDGFFAGQSAADFRLYVRGQETPLEVYSPGSGFAAGDWLRFYLPISPSIDSDENEAVLSLAPLMGSTAPPMRMQTLNGDPTGAPASTEQGSWERVIAGGGSQNQFYIQDVPLGIDGAEHFYWTRIYQDQGVAPESSATFSVAMTLPNLLQTATENVTLILSGRGRGVNSVNPVHHLGIFVNNVPFMVADQVVAVQGPTTVTFSVPAKYFAPGINNVQVVVLGDLVPAGDTDLFDINTLEADFRADRVAVGNQLEFYSYQQGAAVSIQGFATPAMTIFDVTDPQNVMIVGNAQATTDSSGSGAVFAAVTDSSGDGSFHYFAQDDSSYLKPTGLKLGQGADLVLKSQAPGADLLVVGPSALLEAAQPLIAERRAEGLRVVTAPLDQVYAEFSNGVESAQAIQDLVQWALVNWTAPAPAYLLLLGDATYDPRNRLGYGQSPEVMPTYLQSGTYNDFHADNWYVVGPGGGDMPLMAVGRIPADNPSQITQYVTKLLAYESGALSPVGPSAATVTMITDSSLNSEGFEATSAALEASIRSLKKGEVTSSVDRAALGSDAATQAAIIDSFNTGPFAMTYVGHGAENMWAGSDVFTTDEASALKNTKLPFVMAFNCLNAYFYDADPSYQGLGEALVLNPSGGAIAFWGSTAMTTTAMQNRLATAFFSQFAQSTNVTPHVVRYGDLILQAKASIGSSPSTQDTLRSYTLIGDPSTKIPLNVFTGTAAATAGPPAGATSSGSDDQKSGGGFLSCGSIRSGGGGGKNGRGGGGDGGGSAAAEFGLLVMTLVASRKFTRRRVFLQAQ